MKQYAGDTSLAGLAGLDLDWYEEAPGRLTEAEFGYAFAALYRGLDGAQLPIGVRWGTATVDAGGGRGAPAAGAGAARSRWMSASIRRVREREGSGRVTSRSLRVLLRPGCSRSRFG